MSDWQPIETAPRNGTPVLLWSPSVIDEILGRPIPLSGHWRERESSGGHKLNGRWQVAEWDPVCDKFQTCEPLGFTHWMPLPEPPLPTQETSNG